MSFYPECIRMVSLLSTDLAITTQLQLINPQPAWFWVHDLNHLLYDQISGVENLLLKSRTLDTGAVRKAFVRSALVTLPSPSSASPADHPAFWQSWGSLVSPFFSLPFHIGLSRLQDNILYPEPDSCSVSKTKITELKVLGKSGIKVF